MLFFVITNQHANQQYRLYSEREIMATEVMRAGNETLLFNK